MKSIFSWLLFLKSHDSVRHLVFPTLPLSWLTDPLVSRQCAWKLSGGSGCSGASPMWGLFYTLCFVLCALCACWPAGKFTAKAYIHSCTHTYIQTLPEAQHKEQTRLLSVLVSKDKENWSLRQFFSLSVGVSAQTMTFYVSVVVVVLPCGYQCVCFVRVINWPGNK